MNHAALLAEVLSGRRHLDRHVPFFRCISIPIDLGDTVAMSNRRCRRHPKYLGKAEPRSRCLACWRVHGYRAAIKDLEKSGAITSSIAADRLMVWLVRGAK